MRTLRPDTRRDVEQRFREIVEGGAKLFGARATIRWDHGYPVTANDPARTADCVGAARQAAEGHAVIDDWPVSMGAEDFSYMLERRPGAFNWLGNGSSADVHNQAYDFNDDAIRWGVRYWCAMADRRLTPGAGEGAERS